MNQGDRAAIEKHLGLVQGVIERMARNSFMLKGWSLSVISALTVYLKINGAGLGILLLLLPLLAFWLLDAYFLQQERLFRRVYDRVVAEANGKLGETPALDRYQIKPPPELRVSADPIWSIAFGPTEGAHDLTLPNGVVQRMEPLNTILAFHLPLALLVVLVAATSLFAGAPTG